MTAAPYHPYPKRARHRIPQTPAPDPHDFPSSDSHPLGLRRAPPPVKTRLQSRSMYALAHRRSCHRDATFAASPMCFGIGRCRHTAPPIAAVVGPASPPRGSAVDCRPSLPQYRSRIYFTSTGTHLTGHSRNSARNPRSAYIRRRHAPPSSPATAAALHLHPLAPRAQSILAPPRHLFTPKDAETTVLQAPSVRATTSRSSAPPPPSDVGGLSPPLYLHAIAKCSSACRTGATGAAAGRPFNPPPSASTPSPSSAPPPTSGALLHRKAPRTAGDEDPRHCAQASPKLTLVHSTASPTLHLSQPRPKLYRYHILAHLPHRLSASPRSTEPSETASLAPLTAAMKMLCGSGGSDPTRPDVRKPSNPRVRPELQLRRDGTAMVQG